MNISNKRKKKSKDQEKLRRRLNRSTNYWSGLTTSNYLEYLTQYPITIQDTDYRWEILK